MTGDERVMLLLTLELDRTHADVRTARRGVRAGESVFSRMRAGCFPTRSRGWLVGVDLEGLTGVDYRTLLRPGRGPSFCAVPPDGNFPV